MKKHRHKINIVLLAILTNMLFLFWFSYIYGTIQIRHYIAILFFTTTLISIFFNKNLFTLLLGITLLIGNFGGLSFSNPISMTYLNFAGIPIYWGQPEFTFFLVIYFLFNKEFYNGILTNEYWTNFLTRTEDLELVVVTIKPDQEEEIKENVS